MARCPELVDLKACVEDLLLPVYLVVRRQSLRVDQEVADVVSLVALLKYILINISLLFRIMQQ